MKSKYLTTIIVIAVILIGIIYLTQKNTKVPAKISSVSPKNKKKSSQKIQRMVTSIRYFTIPLTKQF